MSLLEDSCFRVRKAAAAFLSLLGHCSGSHSKLEISRSFCHALHRETSSEVRCATVDAMGQFVCTTSLQEEQTMMLLATLSHSLKDPCPHVCARAMAALNLVSKCSRDLKLVALPAAHLLTDNDRFVRARAVSTVATLGRLGDVTGVVADLSMRCKDSSPEVQQIARAALRHLRPPGRPLTNSTC
ncbi:unnamed protein product [Durusdinium trenchii]